MKIGFVIAAWTVVVINIIAVFFFDVPFGLFMVPISLCGAISLYHVVRLIVLSKRRGVLLPLVFYFYCTIFFATYLAPILHYSVNFWLMANNTLILPKKWDYWVFLVGLLNLIGLLIFVQVYKFFRNKKFINRKIWLPSKNRNKYFYVYLLAAVSILVQIYIYAKLGGISGYVDTYETRVEDGGFAGFGVFFIISEFFPIILVFLFYIRAQSDENFKSAKYIFLFLIFLFITCLLFGGLRGSRSNTILTVMHAGMLIHFFIRKFSVKEISIGLVCLVSFMYVYKFYKQGGTEAVKAYYEGRIDYSNEKYDFGLVQLLLNDFARADIQPYLIYRYENSSYIPKYGLTYFGGILHYVPPSLISYTGPTKKKAATELLYGRPGESLGWYSTRIYGMLGEYILNFGYHTSFLIFVPLGIFLAFLDKWAASLERGDLRNFLYPLLIIMIILLFSTDFDNLVFFFMKRIFLVMVIIKVGSDKYIRRVSTNVQ